MIIPKIIKIFKLQIIIIGYIENIDEKVKMDIKSLCFEGYLFFIKNIKNFYHDI